MLVCSCVILRCCAIHESTEKRLLNSPSSRGSQVARLISRADVSLRGRQRLWFEVEIVVGQGRVEA